MKSTNLCSPRTLVIALVAVTVFAASTSAQLPPVGSGSVLVHLKADAANVQLGDDNVVTQWNDVSGNANHFLQNDPALQPEWVNNVLGGRPAIRFTNDRLDTAGLLSADRLPFTFFAVTHDTRNPFALFDSAPQAQNTFRFDAFGPPFSGPHYAVEFWDRSPGVLTGLDARGSIMTVTGYRNGTNNRVLETRETSIHGTTASSATGNTNPVAFGGNGGPDIGTINTGPNGFYAGDIAELIIYSGQLSAADTLAVEQYLSGQYGIAEAPAPPSATPSGLGRYGQAVLASQPVAYWRLETNDTPPADTADGPGIPQSGPQNGIYQDITPHSLAQPGPRPSDLVNGQPLLGFASDNKGIDFRGNGGGANDAAIFADDGNLNMAPGAAFSIEAWVKAMPGQEDGAAILAKGTGGGGEQFALDVVGGSYRFYLWNGGAPNVPTVLQSTVRPDGTWQHLVGVFDAAEDLMKLYVNGAEVGAVPEANVPPTIISNTEPVSVGGRRGGVGPNYDLNFGGQIDEVAIYSYALPGQQIQDHFQAALVPEPSSAALAVLGIVAAAFAVRRRVRRNST